MARIKTVEHDPGWGWIARDPWTGEEVWPNFVWRTRDVARCVVEQARRRGPPADLQKAETK
jgi:hypothetical protein